MNKELQKIKSGMPMFVVHCLIVCSILALIITTVYMIRSGGSYLWGFLLIVPAVLYGAWSYGDINEEE